jgi:hypothetical protein
MRSIFEVLQEKETQLRVLEKEVEALRVAARIMTEAEGSSAPGPVPVPVAAAVAGESKKRWP